MRAIGAAVIATSLVFTNVFAAAAAPLPSGKPAGVNQAAALGPNFALILLGLGVVIGGVVLATTNSSEGVTSPNTTSTSTTGLP
jgi:hypothetical protein